MAIIVFARGTTEARDLFHLWHDELEEKIRNHQGPWKDQEEKYRELWTHVCWPYLHTHLQDPKKAGYQHGDLHLPQVLDGVMRPGTSRAWPGLLGQRLPQPNLNYDVANMVNLAKKFDLDGIIFHSNRSCKLMDFRQYEVQRRVLEECGVPSVIFDGDQTDPRLFSEAQYETRIQALAEMMAENKAKKGRAAQ